jgi:hypothetical protein
VILYVPHDQALTIGGRLYQIGHLHHVFCHLVNVLWLTHSHHA